MAPNPDDSAFTNSKFVLGEAVSTFKVKDKTTGKMITVDERTFNPKTHVRQGDDGDDGDVKPLKKMTVAELTAEAKARGIEIPEDSLKKDILALLTAQ